MSLMSQYVLLYREKAMVDKEKKCTPFGWLGLVGSRFLLLDAQMRFVPILLAPAPGLQSN